MAQITWEEFKEKVEAAIIEQGGDPENVWVAYMDMHGWTTPEELFVKYCPVDKSVEVT